MKQFRILLPLLILALLLSGCAESVREPYNYTQRGQTVFVDPEKGTITHEDEVYTYTLEISGSQASYKITYPNGSWYYWNETKNGGVGGWSDDYEESTYLPGDLLVNALEGLKPREKTGNVFVGIFLMILGGVNFFLPELSFYLRYGWAVENAEPSDTYITVAKIGGVLAAVVGLVWCLI